MTGAFRQLTPEIVHSYLTDAYGGMICRALYLVCTRNATIRPRFIPFFLSRTRYAWISSQVCISKMLMVSSEAPLTGSVSGIKLMIGNVRRRATPHKRYGSQSEWSSKAEAICGIASSTASLKQNSLYKVWLLVYLSVYVDRPYAEYKIIP